MQIVEVRFIKDTQSVQTGNEFYAAGSKAHFFANQADVLVAQARVVIASDPSPGEPPKPAPEPKLIITISPEYLDGRMVEYEGKTYGEMTVKQLKTLAIVGGIPFNSRTRKADLIAALEEKDG